MARDTLAHAASEATKTTHLAPAENAALAASTPQAHPALPAVLSKRDLTVLMVLVTLFIANTNGVQFAGPSAFLYWVLGFLTFLVPCAYVTRWLACNFPGQAAPYLWATRVLGARWSFFSAFCAWLPGVLAVVSAIESGLLFVQYLFPTWFTTPLQQGIAIIVILVVPTAITCLPLRWLRHILLLIAGLYVAAFLLLGVAGWWWLTHGHATALAFNQPATWLPTQGNAAVYGVIVLAYLGVDVPLFMGGEIRGGATGIKRATSYVWWGMALVVLAYMLGTFGIMAIVPSSQAGTMAAPILAIRAVLGPAAATATAIILALSQVGLTIAYLLLFSRLLLVLAQDRRLPSALSIVNRFGVPVRSIISQALVVASVTVLALVTLPLLFGAFIQTGESALIIYNIMQAATTIIWVISIIQMFTFVPWLLFRHHWNLQVPTQKRVLLLGMSLLGIGSSLVALWITASSSWLPTLIPNTNWTILVLGVSLFSGLMGWLGGDLPRMYALLREQKQVSDRELRLRIQLQETYDEQQVLMQQQQVLVAELNRLYHEQARAALTDAVTGLPNHRAIIGSIEEVISSCRQSLSSCAILFVDLDHFKKINDTWGHRAGDAILREVGRRLRSSVRQEDVVGRYGGEEFALVLREVNIQEAQQMAERVLITLRNQPCEWEREDTHAIVPITVTASIGVAIYQLHGYNREELIHSADQAMYQAKRAGRNRVCIADASMETLLQISPCRQEDLLIDEDKLREQTGVQALAIAATTRDGGTGAHAHRMFLLVEAVGHRLSLTGEELHLLRLSAILHDLGKIGIPDAILNKPGPLNEQEWAIMRTHPQIGQQMLEELGGVFTRLAQIVVAHHERWDGTGYPHGIGGEQIPLCARILSVVDAFDAMTSRRSYHEPLSISEAGAELLCCSGSQFDPRIVTAFLQVVETPEEALSGS